MPKGNKPHLELLTGGVGTKLEVRDSSASTSALKREQPEAVNPQRNAHSEATGACHDIVCLHQNSENECGE